MLKLLKILNFFKIKDKLIVRVEFKLKLEFDSKVISN